MRVWIDLANSPHVPLFGPVVDRLEQDGDGVVVTARDHAQTVELARERWPHVTVIGGASPPGRVRKGASILRRATALRQFARRAKPDVALSHGSYAQIVAARAAGVPAVTMMDYEFQPANHLSFRLARRVIVPVVFPAGALRRCGARPTKVVRYDGFKEELYLERATDQGAVPEGLGLDPSRVLAVMRPPPEGALYHRGGNDRFEEVLAFLEADRRVDIVLLPRGREQQEHYAGRRLVIPEEVVDGVALLRAADLVIGGGGTMTREAALLGTPTYTVFMAELAAVDAELIRQGRITDLREAGYPTPEKRDSSSTAHPERAGGILEVIISTVIETTT